MTGMDQYLLEANVPVLMISGTQPDGKQIQKNAKIWHSLLWDNGMHTAKPAQPEVIQVLVGAVNKKMLTKGNFLTVQTIDYYCREVRITVSKSRSVYPYD